MGAETIVQTRSGRTESGQAVAYELERVCCGKPACRTCPHGPYWYAYWREGPRLRKRYIGKKFRELRDRELERRRRHGLLGNTPDELAGDVLPKNVGAGELRFGRGIKRGRAYWRHGWRRYENGALEHVVHVTDVVGRKAHIRWEHKTGRRVTGGGGCMVRIEELAMLSGR